MLSITRFPRRFPTASKRPLRAHALSTLAKSVSAIAMPASARPSSALAPSMTERRIPSYSFQIRSVQSHASASASSSAGARNAARRPTAGTTSSFGTSAAVAAQDDDMATDHDAWLYGDRPDEWFTTSRDPRSDPSFPGLDPVKHSLSALPQPDLRVCSRQQLIDYFDNTWALTDSLFAALQGEHAFMTPPPHHLRHPLIFYYGHPTAFFVNKCRVAGLIEAPMNAYFEEVFEVGVDEMRWDDMSKNVMEWPDVADALAYRREVYSQVRAILETHPGLESGHAPIDESNQLWSLVMAIEHERIHLETSSVLMQEHPVDFFCMPPLLPGYHKSCELPSTEAEAAAAIDARAMIRPVAGQDFPQNDLLPVAGGRVTIGKPRDAATFGWDNEYGHRELEVASGSRASRFMVSNGEFLEFVASGGYADRAFWSELGWDWRCFRNTKWPSFWVQHGPAGSHQYALRALVDVVPMQWDWPVQVNLHEAQAFCRWKNARDGNEQSERYHLTTEPIHHLMRDAADRHEDAAQPQIMTAQDRNLNMTSLSFSPVDAHPPTQHGFHDVFGNAWEWCEDYFAPLPGFQVHKYYDDFSAPCFDGAHHVIMGGSYMSSGDNGASKFARYHFRPHFFQHAGFRVVSTPVDAETQSFRLTTTDVNAPGPYATRDPFRKTDLVSLAGSNSLDASAFHVIVEELQRKSDDAVAQFLDATNAMEQSVMRTRGLPTALQVKDKVQPGGVLVTLLTSEEEHEALHATLQAAKFSLLREQQLPVWTKETPSKGQLELQTVSAWRKHE